MPRGCTSATALASNVEAIYRDVGEDSDDNEINSKDAVEALLLSRGSRFREYKPMHLTDETEVIIIS